MEKCIVAGLRGGGNRDGVGMTPCVVVVVGLGVVGGGGGGDCTTVKG